MIFFANFFLLLLLLLKNACGSHFRGGLFMIRPRPGGAPNEMEIFYHISWRRNSIEGGDCSTSTIESGQLIGEGPLTCKLGCISTHIDWLHYQCTDFSSSENWSFGERKLFFTFPMNSNSITVGFTGSCCWISPFSSPWNLLTTFSMIPRADTGVINSTPRAATSPVIRLQYDLSHKIPLSVFDPDGDVVKCRWGVGSECYDVCGAFPGATIDSDTCTISYTANQGTGYKVAAVAIEDFQTASSLTPYSTVVLQFLVYVFSCSEPCSAPPIFLSPPTFQQGICVAVKPNGTFTTQVMANSGNTSDASVTEIITISPSGTSKGTLIKIENSTLYYTNVSWTPSEHQQGETRVLCYTAVSSTGSTSVQTCIQIHPGIFPPEPNITSLSPASNELVSPVNTTWSVQFDKDIQQPSVSAFIEFHSAINDEVIYMIDTSSTSVPLSEVTFNSTRLYITPNFTFPEKQYFYITFQFGIVNSLEGCGAGNEAVTNKTFWTFQTGTLSDPVNTSLHTDHSEGADYYLGLSMNATCYSTGKPIPTVSWYVNGTLLIPTASNGISIFQTITGQNVISVLSIPYLMNIHDGTYVCQGTNVLHNGTVTTDGASFTISIVASPTTTDSATTRIHADLTSSSIMSPDDQENPNKVVVPTIISICIVFVFVSTCCVLIVILVTRKRRSRKDQYTKEEDPTIDLAEPDDQPLALYTRRTSNVEFHQPSFEIYFDAKRKVSISNQRGIVYSIPCKTCGKVYIGETDMSMRPALLEHKRKVKAKDPDDLISLHVLDTAHEINWDKNNILYFEENDQQRKLIQQNYIQRNKDNHLNLLRVNPLYKEMEEEEMEDTSDLPPYEDVTMNGD